MKTKYLEKIGDYTVIRFVTNATVDGESTKRKIEPLITENMTDSDIEKLFNANLVYAGAGENAENIGDVEGAKIIKLLDEMGEHKKLSNTLEYIPDYRNVEYQIKKKGKWSKEKIEGIGIALPKDAILTDQLTSEQNMEIAEQLEGERIASLTPEQRENEKNTRLHALARETLMRAEESELLGEVFDKQAYLQPKKVGIEKLYA